MPEHTTTAPAVGASTALDEIIRPLTVALAGQPNVGKSTIFNMLTGLNQHVGNWPGKTIAQKTGQYRHNGVLVNLVDRANALRRHDQQVMRGDRVEVVEHHRVLVAVLELGRYLAVPDLAEHAVAHHPHLLSSAGIAEPDTTDQQHR